MNDDADDDGAGWDDVCGEWESRRLVRPWLPLVCPARQPGAVRARAGYTGLALGVGAVSNVVAS